MDTISTLSTLLPPIRNVSENCNPSLTSMISFHNHSNLHLHPLSLQVLPHRLQGPFGLPPAEDLLAEPLLHFGVGDPQGQARSLPGRGGDRRRE